MGDYTNLRITLKHTGSHSLPKGKAKAAATEWFCANAEAETELWVRARLRFYCPFTLSWKGHKS